MSYTPPFISQRTPNDGTLDDCTWAAGAMLIAKMTLGGTVPSWAALRAASGDTGPSSLDDLRRGAKKLLDIDVPVKSLGWSALLAELGKGSGAVVQGTYERLPAKYRTVSPSSRGGHAGYVQDYAGGTTIAWFDPLGTGPVQLPVEYLKAFMSGYGRVAIAREGSAAAPKTADTSQATTPGPASSNQGGPFDVIDRILIELGSQAKAMGGTATCGKLYFTLNGKRANLATWLGVAASTPYSVEIQQRVRAKLEADLGAGKIDEGRSGPQGPDIAATLEGLAQNVLVAGSVLVTIGVLGYAGIKRLMPD